MMPEFPDFESIVARCFDQENIKRPHDVEAAPFVEALRQVWNSRGAADVATLEEALLKSKGVIASYVELDKLVRKLDR